MKSFVLQLSCLVALSADSLLEAQEIKAEVVFARKVQPLLKAKCLACHGEDPEKIKGDLDMRTRAGLLKGGESEEPSIVPGKPLQSPLYLAVTREHEDDWEAMPPKENDRLSAEQVGYIRKWIGGGAPCSFLWRIWDVVNDMLSTVHERTRQIC